MFERKENKIFQDSEILQDSRIEWREYVRNGISWHHAEQAANSLFSGYQKYFGRGLKHFMCYFEGGAVRWCYDPDDLYQMGRIIVESLIRGHVGGKGLFEQWDSFSQQLLELFIRYPYEVLMRMAPRQLFDVYQQYDELMYQWYGLAMAIDATDETLMIDITERVTQILKTESGSDFSEEEFSRVYNILTSPSSFSYVNEERVSMLRLAEAINSNVLKRGSQEYYDCVSNIADQYWWTSFDWTSRVRKSVHEVEAVVDEILKEEDLDIAHELEQADTYEARIQDAKAVVYKQYPFKEYSDLQKWLGLSDVLAKYHDFRKEVQLKGSHWSYGFFEVVSERYGVSTSLLDMADTEHILALIKGNAIDLNELHQRTVAFYYHIIDGERLRLSGDEAAVRYKLALSFELDSTRDVRGVGVSGGKVVGEVRIVLTSSDAVNIERGQVLVAGMTTPDFVPAMKKAAAVVTDEGGVTCHAAIVSRELGVPCVIGTKIATKVLKDGDMVEVDAEKGVVKKLGK